MPRLRKVVVIEIGISWRVPFAHGSNPWKLIAIALQHWSKRHVFEPDLEGRDWIMMTHNATVSIKEIPE